MKGKSKKTNFVLLDDLFTQCCLFIF